MSEFKVKFNQNVKLGSELYRKDESAIVKEEVCGELETIGVIYDDYQPLSEDPKNVGEMTVSELKEYATENDIDLGEAKKRDDILTVIQASEEERSSEK